MPRRNVLALLTFAALTLALILAFHGNPLAAQSASARPAKTSGFDRAIAASNEQLIAQGREIFRYDTFGDEAFWGDALKLHQAIAGAKNGGVGAGVSPKTALSVGLKVDMDALPAAVVAGIKAGKVNLDDPATTLTLLQLNSVVGVTGRFSTAGKLTAIGIQCALCHSTVDDAFAPGIGHRLDGWPNRDLNVGAIVSLSPDLSVVDNLLGVDDATTRKVLASWGPGKFDAELFLDGKAFRPDGKTAATLIPPAFGLAGVNLHTFEGWGSVTYWNAFVANLEMHGKGDFTDSRLADSAKFPVAAKAGFNNVRNTPDLITSKLGPLHAYQLSIPAPAARPGSFNTTAAARGQALFVSRAKCSSCHMAPLYTEPGWNMHTPAEIGVDDFQSSRSPDNRYRTTPLRGLSAHAKGGFYHDGRFADYRAVVEHYDQHLRLGLTEQEKNDLIEFLKSL